MQIFIVFTITQTRTELELRKYCWLLHLEKWVLGLNFYKQYILIFGELKLFGILLVLLIFLIFNFFLNLAEVPADSFVIMRDYVDALNCSKLPQFSKENLMNGFNTEMYKIAREKYKLCKV